MSGDKPFLTLPVQKVTQPVGDFFIASIDAEALVEISSADIRRMEKKRDFERYLGIQRPLNETRVKAIRQYIHTKDATFPTAVIIAIDEKCAEYDEKKQTLTLYAFENDAETEEDEIPFKKIAKILDGQHRLAGFLDGDGDQREFKFNKPFQINVSIFVGIDVSEQAKIFATVNLQQTKVNKSLVYDLEGLAKKRNPFKTCHQIAVALDKNDDSPLHQRIKRLGVATPGRKFEPITQASFVESLVRFLSEDPIRDRNIILDGGKPKPSDEKKCPFSKFFIDGEEGDLKIYDILFNYFSAVKNKWPNAWDDLQASGNLLPKSNAFKALMKYLKDDVYLNLAQGKKSGVPSVRDFETAFASVRLSDRDFTTKNFAPGSGGQSAFYKVLSGKMSATELFE
jgi:DGQHR domain-containing protein